MKNIIKLSIRRWGLLKRTDIKGFYGFTLAEVLITLVIIGVIAAMTIPTLINKTDKQEYVSRFKKNYASFSQALNLAQAQNGLLTGWDWGTEQKGFDNIENYILPHLQVAENCKNTTNCSPEYEFRRKNNASWINYKTNTKHYKFVLNDGTVFALSVVASCVENYSRCIDVHFDVNGSKGPNKWGLDIFTLEVFPYTNDIMPRGFRNNTSYNSGTGTWTEIAKSQIDSKCLTGDGSYCGAKILLEGYKMNY